MRRMQRQCHRHSTAAARPLAVCAICADNVSITNACVVTARASTPASTRNVGAVMFAVFSSVAKESAAARNHGVCAGTLTGNSVMRGPCHCAASPRICSASRGPPSTAWSSPLMMASAAPRVRHSVSSTRRGRPTTAINPALVWTGRIHPSSVRAWRTIAGSCRCPCCQPLRARQACRRCSRVPGAAWGVARALPAIAPMCLHTPAAARQRFPQPGQGHLFLRLREGRHC